MADLTLTGLAVLREVSSRGSFTAAARALGYTQSAVSRQVAALEDAAGTPLFRREARGVRLTEAGRALLGHAHAVLDQMDAARRELGGMGGAAGGRVRVGAFPTAVAALVPRALAALRKRQGDGVRVSLREGTTPSQLRRLAAGRADLAVVGALGGRLPEAPGLAFDSLLDDPLLVAVARDHRLARLGSVHLDDLASEPWIAASADPAKTFLGAWEPRGWQPRVELVAGEWTAKLGLVAAGLGVTMVPGLAASAVRADVALVRVRAERPAMRTVLLATRAGGEQHPSAAALADALHDTAAELSSELRQRLARG